MLREVHSSGLRPGAIAIALERWINGVKFTEMVRQILALLKIRVHFLRTFSFLFL
jgi:hypothetical protein